jgi:hypothetical protein
MKPLPVTVNGLPDGGFFFRSRSGSEEAKPNGFVPVAIPSFSRGCRTGRWWRSIWDPTHRVRPAGDEHGVAAAKSLENKVVAAKVTGDPNTSFPSLIPLIKMVSQLILKQEYIFICLGSRVHSHTHKAQ